ncbi:MAG: ABC transporter ATP-binding protein/permease [Chloroflexi bacterium]|nr:ABC transporter ATP-binding protein/permease [Chloroflexota bacterium]MCL5275741.1 ABC transporter ATP-binding protein/permease [Chloroflexota bacterium]
MSKTLTEYTGLLSKYLAPQWRRVLLLALIVFAGIALSLYNPQILKYFIDSATTGAPLQSLIGAGVLYTLIAIVGQLATVAESYIGENIGLIATNQMRADLTLHALSLDPSFHNAHTPGEMIERVDGDVATLGNFFSRFVIRIVANGLLLIGVLILLFQIDWRVGASLCLFTAISFIGLSALNKTSSRLWTAVREATAQLFGFLEERVAGTEDIRSNGGTPYVMRRFAEHSRNLLRKTAPAAIVGSSTWSVTNFMFAAGTVTALALGIMLFSAGTITIGTIFLMYSYTELLSRPIEQISRQMQDLQLASAGITRIRQIFQMRSAIVEQPSAGLPDGPLAVEFDNVVFGYEGEESVVRHLSFRVEPGERLGLLGRTGSGKTTLTRLLFRFYDPGQGAVRLNGIDLRDLALADLRRRVAIVTQDIQLFHGTVRDNLTFFNRTIPDESILKVLDELGMRNWLDRLPSGLNSRLAPGGSGLSAGESQLLAFARVYLKDPGLVILDEASSRLDPATEHRLEQAVDRLLRGRTGIIIAHRLTTVQRVDHIVILEDGVSCESGPREQLASNPRSRFAQLLRTGLEEALA